MPGLGQDLRRLILNCSELILQSRHLPMQNFINKQFCMNTWSQYPLTSKPSFRASFFAISIESWLEIWKHIFTRATFNPWSCKYCLSVQEQFQDISRQGQHNKIWGKCSLKSYLLMSTKMLMHNEKMEGKKTTDS